MTTALIAVADGVDNDYLVSRAHDAAAKIATAAGMSVVQVLVPTYATDAEKAQATMEALARADVLVLTPSSDTTPLGKALKAVADLTGVRVRNVRKIALEVTDGDVTGKMADLLRDCGHVVSDGGWVTTAFKEGISLSQAQSKARDCDEQDADEDDDYPLLDAVAGLVDMIDLNKLFFGNSR